MKGCLLIHGYTGDPSEVKPLAKHLETLGYKTLCPTLPGHTDMKKDLKKTKDLDWINSAEEAYAQLSETCDKIAVLGFSMGGLLAFHVAKKYRVNCLVTMGTPIYCFDIKNLYGDIRDHLRNKNMKRIKEYIASCFTPLQANLNFQKLLYRSKPLIKDIDVPIFVVHGKKDPVAHQKSAPYIYSSVKSTEKKIKLYDHWPHRFHYCHEPELIYEEIGEFLKRHLQ